MDNTFKFISKISAAAICLLASSFSAFAEDYFVVGNSAKVFDSPDATGYVSLNSKNQEVCLSPGMVFPEKERQTGWTVIEYSPGIRGYVSDQAKAQKTVVPKPGRYSVTNNPSEKINTTLSADVWSAIIGGKTLKGKVSGYAVVFFDASGHPAYSLVDLGEGPVVMTYDNAVTKFF